MIGWVDHLMITLREMRKYTITSYDVQSAYGRLHYFLNYLRKSQSHNLIEQQPISASQLDMLSLDNRYKRTVFQILAE